MSSTLRKCKVILSFSSMVVFLLILYNATLIFPHLNGRLQKEISPDVHIAGTNATPNPVFPGINLTDSWSQRKSPNLILFSTWVQKPGKEAVRKSILGTWRKWLPEVLPFLITDEVKTRQEAEQYGWNVINVTETNCSSNSNIPTLRGMFKNVLSLYRDHSLLFGFANGDLLFDDTLRGTLTALMQQDGDLIRSRPVLLLGKRLNVRYTENKPVDDTRMVKQLAKGGKYPQEGSSDYFVTNNLFPWELVPPIVIGRLGFGMWIVAFARAHNVTVYDLTKTVTAVHLTTKEGISESSNVNNAWCNHQLVNRLQVKPVSYECGWIDCADRRSVFSKNGTVRFLKTVDLPKMCNLCD